MTATAVVSPRRQRIAEVAVPAFAAALVAAGLAGGHKKTLFALIGAICLVAVLVMSAHRERAMVAFLTVSMAFILHKSFGSIALENGGAPSFYLSTVGLCVLLLYGCWFYSGDMGADLRNGLRHVVFATPLVGMALVLPSLLVTPSIRLGLTELVQLGMLYLLFVYVAVRLSRRDAEMVLTLLGCLAGVELLAALGQWLTNGPLGLSFLGLPTALGQRITADAVLGRPFGTITHPVFLGAFVGQIGVLFLALAVTARRMWLRVAAIAVSVCTAGTIAVAQARSAALAFAVAAVVVVAVSLAVRRLQWRTVRRALLVLLGVAVVTSPMLLSLYHNSLGTSHFSLEVQARGQLLNLGWHIFSVHPLFGTGLNTFQQVMDQYTSTSLIFDHNPVHNIYVLQAAETGLVGVLAIPVVAVPLLVLASRSARSADRLTSGLGIGLIAITSFLAVEELFVFSLREDHPRSLYWLIAGLSVAGARFARLVPGRDAGPAADRDLPVRVATRAWRWLTPPLPPKRRVPAVRRVRPSAGAAFSLWREDLASVGRRRAGRRAALRAASGRESRRLPRWASGVVALAAAGSLLAGSGTVAARAEAGKLQVVLSLTDRASGAQGLYVANGDGSQIHPITSERDGSTYSFASWTPGGDRIVYAATHAGGPGQLFLAAGDGSLSVPMTNVPWQSGQPHMSPDGRSLLFTSASPEFPLYGLYRMDIATGLVTNLSQQFSTAGAADTDPSWSPDGRSIVFVQGAQVRGTGATTTPSQVYTMSAAGTGRVRVTNDSYYDVDPAYSPDGGTVAFSSYHGQHPGNDTGDGGPLSPTVKLDDFFLVTHDLRTGAERVFNKGLNCATRDPGNPCGPLDGPAYLPKYLPGGHSIAYMGVLDSATVCICAVDADGSDPRVLLSFKTQTVNWYDFTVPGSQPATSATPLSAAPADRLLVLGTDAAGTPELFIATPDNWTRVRVRLPKKLQVVAARWGVDGRHVLLTARTAPVRAATVRPEPAPPPGQARHVHYTLGSLSALTLATAPTDRTSVDREQLFSMDIVTGTATALTTPGTEDWLDGIPSGAWRGNGAGVVTPDHRSVVFASYASDTDESFLLRKNLATGSVRSLTAQTAGAVPVYDDKPAVSSDGTTVAFTTGTGTSTNIALISATTGEHYRLLTNDDYVNTTPVWSPDGTWVAYASLRGGKWALVRVDVATGRQTVLARTYGQPVSPVVAPDGSRVAFIAYNVAPAQPDVQIVNASGGTLRPLQVTLATKEVSLDWR